MLRTIMTIGLLLLAGCVSTAQAPPVTTSTGPSWCLSVNYWPHVVIKLNFMYSELTIRYEKDLKGFVSRYNQIQPRSSFAVPEKIVFVDVPTLSTLEILFIVDDCVVNAFLLPRRIMSSLRGFEA